MLSELTPLIGARASTSSKNIMHGDACLAFLNTSLTAFSDSPTHLLRSSGPLTDMKLAELSVATAFASIVLPVPDGPYRSIPSECCNQVSCTHQDTSLAILQLPAILSSPAPDLLFHSSAHQASQDTLLSLQMVLSPSVLLQSQPWIPAAYLESQEVSSLRQALFQASFF